MGKTKKRLGDFKPAADPSPVLKDDALYLGDNGRCFCGKHAGASARYTGRDLSGQKVLRITKAFCDGYVNEKDVPKCETCSAQAGRAVR